MFAVYSRTGSSLSVLYRLVSMMTCLSYLKNQPTRQCRFQSYCLRLWLTTGKSYHTFHDHLEHDSWGHALLFSRVISIISTIMNSGENSLNQ